MWMCGAARVGVADDAVPGPGQRPSVGTGQRCEARHGLVKEAAVSMVASGPRPGSSLGIGRILPFCGADKSSLSDPAVRPGNGTLVSRSGSETSST